jgi:hypothetical protein
MSSAIRRLAEDEFRATFAASMQRVGPEEYPPFDFWPYFEAIPQEDFGSYDCADGTVTSAWRTGDGRYEHVLIDSKDRDVFMVLVLDLKGERVTGHHLLDLPGLYGLRE